MARLPEELAPTLRRAAEQLIAEVGEHDGYKPLTPRVPRRRCWRCAKTGPLVLHHLADGTVVYVHRRCHRKIHRSTGKRRPESGIRIPGPDG